MFQKLGKTNFIINLSLDNLSQHFIQIMGVSDMLVTYVYKIVDFIPIFINEETLSDTHNTINN